MLRPCVFAEVPFQEFKRATLATRFALQQLLCIEKA
jgi:hypothetical protein